MREVAQQANSELHARKSLLKKGFLNMKIAVPSAKQKHSLNEHGVST